MTSALSAKPITLQAEEIRRKLPVEEYTRLLHVALTTGYMPVFNLDGSMTDQCTPIDSKTRVDLAKYLTDKCMPTPKPAAEQPALPALDLIAERSTILRSLTIDQLRQLRDKARE